MNEPVIFSVETVATRAKKKCIYLEEATNDSCAQSQDFSGLGQALTGLEYPNPHPGGDVIAIHGPDVSAFTTWT